MISLGITRGEVTSEAEIRRALDHAKHVRLRPSSSMGTGDWAIFTPKPFEDARVSRWPRRGTVDQKQVEALKQKAYEAGAKDLIRLYSRPSVAADR